MYKQAVLSGVRDKHMSYPKLTTRELSHMLLTLRRRTKAGSRSLASLNFAVMSGSLHLRIVPGTVANIPWVLPSIAVSTVVLSLQPSAEAEVSSSFYLNRFFLR